MAPPPPLVSMLAIVTLPPPVASRSTCSGWPCSTSSTIRVEGSVRTSTSAPAPPAPVSPAPPTARRSPSWIGFGVASPLPFVVRTISVPAAPPFTSPAPPEEVRLPASIAPSVVSIRRLPPWPPVVVP
ncbi:MAG: hypothetical protein E6J87_23980 [Deltaproteobacteria bacterium]|nr:MAG: hypothetical protein E6J87_23980 [Deltaproteobacteria bacterium]